MATKVAEKPAALIDTEVPAETREPANGQPEEEELPLVGIENGRVVTKDGEVLGYLDGYPTEGARKMPDYLRKHMLHVQGGKLYLPVAFRLVWFQEEHAEWGIETDLVEGGQDAGFATCRAVIRDPDGRIRATGHKTETRVDFPAGWVEKSETGAIGRALALIGFGTACAGDDLDEGDRYADAPQPSRGFRRGQQPARQQENGGQRGRNEVWEGPGQCPKCHAPEGKRHGKPCVA